MRHALVTGASSGIGRELARDLAAEGCDLTLTARREERLRDLAAEVRERGVEVRVLAHDLSDPAACDRLVEELQAAKVEIDVLVNNAGVGDFGDFAQADPERLQRMIQLNVTSLTRLTRLLLPGMLRRGEGRILNVASTAAFQPGPHMAVYFATKAYVLHFSEALAEELSGTGVTVTALFPGATRSEFFEEAGMQSSGLIQGRPLPSAAQVAAFGLRAMKKGRRVAVHGPANRLLILLTRVMPRRVLSFVTGRVMAARH